MSQAYKQSGVDVHAGYEVVERIKKHVAKTNRLGALGTLGGFGGLFDLGCLNYKQPVLVSGTDGVGTKILLAIQQKKFDTIGIDCVAMCVNDIVAQGAEPLFFLDYIAVGKNKPDIIEQIVSGVSQGCCQSKVALIGGETAEMPDVYAENDFDLAGFTVGIVEKDEMITCDLVEKGDILIGLESSGVHSNGYSLVRQLFFKDHAYSLDHQFDELHTTLGLELLKPTRIYVNDILTLHRQKLLHGVAHITGGGFMENIPRMLPKHLTAKITLNSWEIPAVFNLIQSLGGYTNDTMLRTFNNGIGMVIAVSRENVTLVMKELERLKTKAYIIGEVMTKKEQASLVTEHEVVL